jgi:hypothetical protein
VAISAFCCVIYWPEYVRNILGRSNLWSFLVTVPKTFVVISGQISQQIWSFLASFPKTFLVTFPKTFPAIFGQFSPNISGHSGPQTASQSDPSCP